MKPRNFIFIALSLFAFADLASAHAFLDHAQPRVGSTVSKPPAAVELWFTQQPEHAFSTIQIFNADGKQIDKSDTRTDPNDAKALLVSVGELPPGTYKVVWHVLSIDTHRTQGEFKFTVKP
jgi:methionine-rich copper-binding protein CopC